MFCRFSLLYVLINVFVVWIGGLLCLLLALCVGGWFCFGFTDIVCWLDIVFCECGCLVYVAEVLLAGVVYC